jgi:hypothetical protein
MKYRWIVPEQRGRIRQDSIDAQLRDVLKMAVEAGCHDAHDWITEAMKARSNVARRSARVPTRRGS